MWLHVKAGLITVDPLVATQLEWGRQQFNFDKFLEAKPDAIESLKLSYELLRDRRH